ASPATYTPLAANDIIKFVQAGITVPAGVAYVRPALTISTPSGHATAGAISWASALVVYSGNIADPTYGDGSFAGWKWNGAADASTSSQTAPTWVPADETETLRGVTQRVADLEGGGSGSSTAPVSLTL